jgi:hypothetical protein
MSEHDDKHDQPNTRPESDGRVGYGRPPVEHQYKKGQSGNPKGRPHGDRGRDETRQLLRDAMLKEAGRKIRITENGKARRITIAEVVAKKAWQAALNDDTRLLIPFLRLLFSEEAAQRKDAEENTACREVELVIYELPNNGRAVPY